MALTDKASPKNARPHTAPAIQKPASAASADMLGNLAAVSLGRHIASDAMHPGELLGLELEASLRASQELELGGQDTEGRLEWALGRILRLEARLLVLQAAMLSLATQSPREAAPASAALAEVPPAKPPVVTATAPIVKPEAVSARAQPVAKEAVLRFDANLRCKGFYDSENRQGRPPSRWIGPSTRAELWLPRVDTPLELRFAVAGLFVPEVLNEIRFSVDGGPWTKPELREMDGARFLQLRPAPGPNKTDELMHVAIDTVLQDSPVNRGGTDKRKLSIAFWRVEARRV